MLEVRFLFCVFCFAKFSIGKEEAEWGEEVLLSRILPEAGHWNMNLGVSIECPRRERYWWFSGISRVKNR